MRIYVITGPSSCGKSTLIEHLRGRGFFVVREAARSVLIEGVFHPSRDPYLFQQEIARRQAKEEEKMRRLKIDIAFLDRGFHDQIAYCRHTGIAQLPPEIQTNAHYDGVFILEKLPHFVLDGVRVEEDEDEAMHIHKMTAQEYKKRGIPSLFIPAVSVSERADIIIKSCISPSSLVSSRKY